jgi:hypothetical protein
LWVPSALRAPVRLTCGVRPLMKERSRQGWEWSMRIAALGAIIALVCAYSLPEGTVRLVAFAALPVLVIFFICARAKARPNEEFQDTPWNI